MKKRWNLIILYLLMLFIVAMDTKKHWKKKLKKAKKRKTLKELQPFSANTIQGAYDGVLYNPAPALAPTNGQHAPSYFKSAFGKQHVATTMVPSTHGQLAQHLSVATASTASPYLTTAAPSTEHPPNHGGTFPSFEKLFGKTVENGKEYTLLGCTVLVSKDNCNFSFIPQDNEKCPETLSLLLLYNRLFPDEKLDSIVKKFIPILIYSVDKFVADKCSGEIIFEASAREPFNIVQDKLKVKDGNLILQFNYKEISLEQFGITITGTVDINGKNVALLFTKEKDSKEGQFSIKIDQMKISDFTNMMSSRPVDDGAAQEDPSTAKKLDPFLNAVVREPQISGILDVNNFFELVLNGTLDEAAGFEKLTGFVIVQKLPDHPTTLGLLVVMEDLSPAAILSTLLKTDLTRIPLIGDFKMNLILEAANDDLQIIKNPGLDEVLVKFLANGKMLGKGFKLTTKIPIQEIIKNADNSLNVDDIPETIGLQIVVKDRKVRVQFPELPTPQIDLKKFLVAMGDLLSSAAFKDLLRRTPKINLQKFEIDVRTKSIDIALATKESITVGNVELHNAHFQVARHEGGSWNFSIAADQTIGNSTVNFLVAKSGTSYKMTATVTDLTVNSLMEHFGAKNPVADFLNFGIRNLELSAGIETDEMDMDISGNPILFDWEGLKLHGIISLTNEKKSVSFAVLMEHMDLNAFLSKVLNRSFNKLAWMSNLRIFFCISTDDGVELSFENKELTLNEGLSISTEFIIPDNCKGDAFCEVLKDKLKAGTIFSLSGSIRPSGFQLRAAYEHGNIHIADNMYFESAEIILSAGLKGNSIALTGTVRMDSPVRRFTGKLEVDVTGKVALSLLMSGKWINPFNIPNFEFDYAMLGAAVQPAIGLEGLEMASAVVIGKLETKDVLAANLTGGFDVLRPDLSYFYLKLNDITISRIMKAFGQDESKLPKTVQDSGFPEGLLVTYTGNPEGKRIEHMNLNIDFGVTFSGKINILGFTTGCNIKIGSPFDIRIEADMSPIKIAKDTFTLQKSEKDFCNGPHMYFRLSADEVAFNITGFVNLFGIGTEVDITVSDAGFEFFVHGRIFDVVAAQVNISAPYGDGNLMNADYTASSCLSTSLRETTHSANQQLKDAADFTQNALDEADKKVSDAQTICTDSKSKVDQWMSSLNQKQEELNARARTLSETRKYLDNPCVQQCGKICIPGPTIKEDCFRVFGKSFPCPSWDNCKMKTTDPICLAKCKGKKVLEQGKALVEQATLKVLVKGIEILKKIVQFTESVAIAGQKLMNFTVELAKKVEEAAVVGKHILEAFAKYTRDNLVEVKHICFDTKLSAVKNNCFDFDISLVLAGTKQIDFQRNACFDAGLMAEIGGFVGNQVFPGVDKLKDKITESKENLNNIDARKEELQKAQKEAKEKQESLEGDIPETPPSVFDKSHGGRKKDAIWESLPKSKQWAYVQTQMYNSISSVAIRDDLTMAEMNIHSPWALSEHDSPFTKKKVDDEAAQKEDIEDYDNFDNCSSPYALVTGSLKLVAEKYVQEMENFEKEVESRSYLINQLEEELRRSSMQGNLTTNKMDDALYYVRKIRNGTARWIANVRSQLTQQDSALVKMFKKDMGRVVKEKYGMSLSEYLNSQRNEREKKSNVPPKHDEAMDAIDEITREMLYNDNVPLTSKIPLFQKLEQVTAEFGTVC